MSLVSLDDLEALARERLSAADFAYVAGGGWDEVTLRENVAAFRRRRFRPRILVDVARVEAGTTYLGTPVTLPAAIAPMAMQGLMHPAGEVATAMGAREAGSLIVASTLSSRPMEEIAAVGAPSWFQLYVHRDREVVRDLVQRAEASGFSALVVTGDLPVVGHRDRELRAGFRGVPAFGNFTAQRGDVASFSAFVDGLHDQALAWHDIEWVRSLSRLPLVLKGVMTAEDARLAASHGVSGIVVSNHGGRQLDRSFATIDVLEEIVAASDDRLEVYLDGGVRRGLDVLVALALGARGVFVGRPILYALACHGAEGVTAALRLLRREIELGLALLGCGSPADVTRAHVE